MDYGGGSDGRKLQHYHCLDLFILLLEFRNWDSPDKVIWVCSVFWRPQRKEGFQLAVVFWQILKGFLFVDIYQSINIHNFLNRFSNHSEALVDKGHFTLWFLRVFLIMMGLVIAELNADYWWNFHCSYD